ncbi:MAG: PadR family transcriptional regulator [Nitrososphaerales archaeon]
MYNFNWSKRTHRGLRHWILYILKDSPKTGAEVMDAMESMSQGWWRPVPGSVYPLLESMKNDGVVRRLEDKKYELTNQGREEADWSGQFRQASPRSAEEALDQISNYISYLEDLAGSKGAKLAADSRKLKELKERLGKLGGGKE